jgi:hypothetical protein
VWFPIANYIAHQQSLATLLQASCGRPLLFIGGETGHGKTWLLKWFRSEMGPRCSVVKFDLAAQQELLSPSLILRKCANELGSDHFGSFLREAEVYQKARSVVIQNVTIEGSHNVVTGDAGETPREQMLGALDLTRFFIDDLKKFAAPRPPIVFIFDHFDQAGTVVGNWLVDGLIPALRAVPHSRLVLAARQLPRTDDVSWETAVETVTLAGVQDAAAWRALVKLLKRDFPPEGMADPDVFLKGAILVTKGVPGTLMPFIQTFPAAP